LTPLRIRTVAETTVALARELGEAADRLDATIQAAKDVEPAARIALATVEAEAASLRACVRRWARFGAAFARPVRSETTAAALAATLQRTFLPSHSPVDTFVTGSESPVHVDVDMVVSALEALVDNALETGARRAVRLELSVAADGWLRARISDQASRPWPHRITHGFDPFVSTKRRGLGLGLPTARAVAEGHGGWLIVEQHGAGTTVSFEIPAGAEKSDGSPARALPPTTDRDA
jgi:two-component system sensor kinase FixL